MNASFMLGISHVGKRVDRALAELCPEYSLRASRRLIQRGSVFLNGRQCRASMKVRFGDRLEIRQAELSRPDIKPCLLEIQDPYCCFWKPAGMHSALLSGGSGMALEHYVEELAPHGKPELLQRLDFGTSGLVCAAFNLPAMRAFREAEKAGLCDKFYYALLEGRLEGCTLVNNALDTANRGKARVLPAIGRETCFEPLLYCRAKDFPAFEAPGDFIFTFALCRLKAGQRHQVRAHAAHIGHPLAGDALYGSSLAGAFMLEHFRLSFPSHVFQLPTDLSIFPQNNPNFRFPRIEQFLPCSEARK